jgi:hypothetical protein
MADLKNADQSFAEYREKFAQMDDENKQLQRQLDDATLKRESAQDRLRALEVGWLVGWLVTSFVLSINRSLCIRHFAGSARFSSSPIFACDFRINANMRKATS